MEITIRLLYIFRVKNIKHCYNKNWPQNAENLAQSFKMYTTPKIFVKGLVFTFIAGRGGGNKGNKEGLEDFGCVLVRFIFASFVN